MTIGPEPETVAYAGRMRRVRPSAIRELLRLGADPSITSFGGGYPDPALFPVDDLRQVYEQVLVPGNALTLQYAATNGSARLREQVAERLTSDGMACTADDILIVQGAQQGLDLTAKLVVDAGTVVVTENPTFLGALIAFAPTEPTYAPVRTDASGMDTDDLERVLIANPGARLLYTVPDFQNPTGATLGVARRHRLVELANEHNLLVLEDTPYRALRYDGESLPTLKSLDTQGRVVHLGSFSKILAPALRLGWVFANPDILERMTLLKLAADTQNSTLNMAVASRYLSTFDIDRHIERALPVYRQKRDLMLTTMAETFPEGVRFTNPDGGLFVWLTLPAGLDAATFMAEVLLPEARVAYVPGATFFPVEQEPNHARLSFSGVPDDRLVHGVSEIGRLLHRGF